MTIIKAYAPTEEADEEQREIFCEEIQMIINRIPSNDLIIIARDFNAKIGKK